MSYTFTQPYPDHVPSAALAPPVWDAQCCRCVAAPAVVFLKTCVKTTEEPSVWPRYGVGVLEIQLCMHHGDALDSALDMAGWSLVCDRRQGVDHRRVSRLARP